MSVFSCFGPKKHSDTSQNIPQPLIQINQLSQTQQKTNNQSTGVFKSTPKSENYELNFKGQQSKLPIQSRIDEKCLIKNQNPQACNCNSNNNNFAVKNSNHPLRIEYKQNIVNLDDRQGLTNYINNFLADEICMLIEKDKTLIISPYSKSYNPNFTSTEITNTNGTISVYKVLYFTEDQLNFMAKEIAQRAKEMNLTLPDEFEKRYNLMPIEIGKDFLQTLANQLIAQEMDALGQKLKSEGQQMKAEGQQMVAEAVRKIKESQAKIEILHQGMLEDLQQYIEYYQSIQSSLDSNDVIFKDLTPIIAKMNQILNLGKSGKDITDLVHEIQPQVEAIDQRIDSR